MIFHSYISLPEGNHGFSCILSYVFFAITILKASERVHKTFWESIRMLFWTHSEDGPPGSPRFPSDLFCEIFLTMVMLRRWLNQKHCDIEWFHSNHFWGIHNEWGHAIGLSQNRMLPIPMELFIYIYIYIISFFAIIAIWW